MKAFFTNYTKALIIVLFIGIISTSAHSQFRTGAFALNAGMSMPSGLTLSAGIPTSTLTGLTFTYSFASSIGYIVADNFQIDAGIGYLTASFQVPSGPTPESQSLFSLCLGAKYFLGISEIVKPYIGGGFSISSLPKVSAGQNYSTSGSLTTVVAYFGAQSFLNNAKTVALFIQMGLAFNKGTLTTTSGNMSSDNGQTNINFGGSAFGGSIYF